MGRAQPTRPHLCDVTCSCSKAHPTRGSRMSGMKSCIYVGDVVHRRLMPVTHELRYRVYNFFADVDELPQLAKRLKLFSYNKFNLFSIVDCKHGPGDGTPIREFVWSLVRAANATDTVKR